MEKDNRQRLGDGSDNAMQAAKQANKAAKEFAKNSAKGVAQKGAEATGKAAAQAVKGSVKLGKAASEIAAGTAAGGPWGAIISAAWAMRHTLFKILICICLVIVFLVITIVSLPSIILNSIFGLDSNDYKDQSSLQVAYQELSDSVNGIISEGYNFSLNKVNSIISDGDYDYDLSTESITDNSRIGEGYDVCYILAAYSASKMQRETSKDDFSNKFSSVIDCMFPITYEIKSIVKLLDPLGILTETISFVKCVIHPFDNNVILKAFGIDLDSKYGDFNITYGQAIDYMAKSLRLTLNGG